MRSKIIGNSNVVDDAAHCQLVPGGAKARDRSNGEPKEEMLGLQFDSTEMVVHFKCEFDLARKIPDSAALAGLSFCSFTSRS